MIKKIIAREWLIFIGLVVFFGFPIFPFIVAFLLNEKPSEFYIAFVDGEFPAVIFYPYLLFQFGRSLLWAVKALKSKENE
jgi:uncharacterized membrane protein YdjX (TVP38/TMEM64 family)